MKHNLGEYYDRSADFQKTQFDRLVSFMKGNMNVSDVRHMLDIGSGSGARTYSMLDVCTNIMRLDAIEPDPEMISVAREKYAHDKISYHLASAEGLMQAVGNLDVNYDLIFMNWSVHWIQNKEKLLSDIDDISTNSPYLAISTCERLPEILMDVDEYVRQVLMLSPSTEYPWFYLDDRGWQSLLQQAGWRIIKSEPLSVDHYVDDARQYMEHWFAASTSKFLYGRQMEELSDLSFNDLVWFIEQKYPHPEKPGGLYFKEDAIFILAQKES